MFDSQVSTAGPVSVAQRQAGRMLHCSAGLLSALAVVISAIHFWPFEGSRSWELVHPLSIAGIMGLCVVLVSWVGGSGTEARVLWLPSRDVTPFIAVAILSIAVSEDIVRSLMFVAKLVIAFVGVYVLFAFVAARRKDRDRLYTLLSVAACVAVGACLWQRLWGQTSAGCFASVHKYGTYTGMIVPFSSAYLLLSARWACQVTGGVLLMVGVLCSPTIGGFAAIMVGMVSVVVLTRRMRCRVVAVGACTAAVLVMLVGWQTGFMSSFRDDARLREADGVNCRQRYIEWQAMLNLLEDRPVLGAGAGCINEQRSAYYYQLPKLNTLAPFDQNGWLAIAAEMGIIGLVCFAHLVARHLQMAWCAARSADAVVRRRGEALFAGLAGACVAHAFCSVLYNGLVTVFVILLALAWVSSEGCLQGRSDGTESS